MRKYKINDNSPVFIKIRLYINHHLSAYKVISYCVVLSCYYIFVIFCLKMLRTNNHPVLGVVVQLITLSTLTTVELH